MRTLLFTVSLLALLTPVARAQESAGQQMKMDSINQRIRMQKVPEKDEDLPANAPLKVNLDEVQKKTNELNELVKSLNGDVANLKKGVIAADVNQRLKRIEKLAKELRQSLQ
jgi:allophanate hydrolase subunit 1